MARSSTRILVVDDDPDVAQALRTLLESEGYQICVAEDGAKAIEFVKRHVVGLVITDIHMPNRDGIEVILHLRASHPDVKIIAMSGGMSIADYNFLPEARILGAQRVWSKPLDPETILRDLGELLAAQG